MKVIKTIPEYYNEILLPAPKHASFHIGRHENNLSTIRLKQPPVKHELYSISLSNVQPGDLSINNASALELFIVSPFKVISWDITGKMIRGIYIIFDKDFIRNKTGWKNFLHKFPYFRYDSLVTENLPKEIIGELYSYFEKIEAVYNENLPDAFEMIDAYVHLVLLLLKKHLSPFKPAGGSPGSPNQTLLADFETVLLNAVGKPGINAGFRKPSFYASRLHVHVNHLNAVLKQMTGKTTSEFIQQSIIQQSGVLLLQPGQTVKEIAAYYRFSAPTHFIAFFKKQTGITPRQFQASQGKMTALA